MKVPGPQRTCLGCGGAFAKVALLRFVVRNGVLLADPSQSLAGRGVYSCRLERCLKKFAAKKGRLGRALRAEVIDSQVIEALIAKGFAV